MAEVNRVDFVETIRVLNEIVYPTGKVKDFVQTEYGVSKGLTLICMLTRAYGGVEDEQRFIKNIRDFNLGEVYIDDNMSQDKVYGLIKEMEYFNNFFDSKWHEFDYSFGGETAEDIQEAIDNSIEYASGIFNNWDEYKEDVTKELDLYGQPEEFSYEELVDDGEDGRNEEEEVMSRVERRKRREASRRR